MINISEAESQKTSTHTPVTFTPEQRELKKSQVAAVIWLIALIVLIAAPSVSYIYYVDYSYNIWSSL
jgi:hypothetical protein